MFYCTNETDFVKYYKANMAALGLPTPSGLFDGVTAITATTVALAEGVTKYGTKITVTELAIAGTALERLKFIAVVSAAFYAGAAIGSIAVATGRTIGCGASIADALWAARKLGIEQGWIQDVLITHPAITSYK